MNRHSFSQLDDGRFAINNVHLPDSEELDSCNDTQAAVALGSVAHTTQMIASFLNVPTRYPIIHCASRSKVIDHITENIPDKDRQLVLLGVSYHPYFRFSPFIDPGSRYSHEGRISCNSTTLSIS